MPFSPASDDSVSRGRAQSTATDSDDSDGTITIQSAIPVRIQGEQQRLVPTLRVSSAAEHKLRGSRSVSFAKVSEARQSGNIYHPRILRGDTPPSDDQEEASSTTKKELVRAPPRTSSLNALSDAGIRQAAAAGGLTLTPGSEQTICFDDIVTRHPEVEGIVLRSNVVKTSLPRMNRVFNSVRSALSLGRPGRSEFFQIQDKKKGSGIPRPVRSSTVPPATQGEIDRALERLRSEIERPVSRLRRPGLMPSIDQVRVAVNAVARKLVNADSLELRKQWFRVSLHSLCIHFKHTNEPKLTCS